MAGSTASSRPCSSAAAQRPAGSVATRGGTLTRLLPALGGEGVEVAQGTESGECCEGAKGGDTLTRLLPSFGGRGAQGKDKAGGGGGLV